MQSISPHISIQDLTQWFDKLSDVEKRSSHRHLLCIRNELITYLNQLPVLGFNSARYDINLARKQFLDLNGFADEEVKNKYVIKKNNCYTSTVMFCDNLYFRQFSHRLIHACICLETFFCWFRKYNTSFLLWPLQLNLFSLI